MIDVKSARQQLAFIKAGYVYYRHGGWVKNFEELDRALDALETAQADTAELAEENQKLRERIVRAEKSLNDWEKSIQFDQPDAGPATTISNRALLSNIGHIRAAMEDK